MTVSATSPSVLAAFVNYDGAPMTLAAVRSLTQQPGAVGVRIVVVDNGSTPADVEVLTAGLPRGVSLVRLETNRGYGAACNAAARIAAENGIPYVWWLNNDLTLENGASDALLAHMEATPTIAAAGAVTVDEETGRRVLGAGMDLTLWRGRVRHRHTGIDVKQLPRQPYPVDVIPAACLLVRVSALRVIGGIDEGYFMYSEDVDWCMRARAVGFGLDIVPRARARHGGGRSSKPQDRVRYMMRNRIRMVRARAGLAVQPAFMGYFVLGWLPAYTVARLVPRFGLREGLFLALSPLTWNVRDALRYRRWRLRTEDLVIPRF